MENLAVEANPRGDAVVDAFTVPLAVEALATAAPPEPSITFSDILYHSNSRVKYLRFVERPEGQAIMRSALLAGMARDAASLQALSALIGPERVKQAAAAAFEGRQ